MDSGKILSSKTFQGKNRRNQRASFGMVIVGKILMNALSAQ
jgi:hypothetical protein